MPWSETWWSWRDWLTANPEWIFGLIFGLAALEAVAIIGSFIPAVPMMVALTLLAGSAGLDVYQVLGVAILGAMLGDGISYAVGHHYKQRIEGWWPFRTHPHWLSASESYVERHGGKSLIIGRFVGPIRAFVPMAAGIFQMPLRRFLTYNFVSAVIWAPPNILPGFIAGAAVTHPLLPGKLQLFFVGGLLLIVAICMWLLPGFTALTRNWRQGHAPRNMGIFYCADGRTENQVSALFLSAIGFIGFIIVAATLPLWKQTDMWAAYELHQLRQPAIDYLFLVFSLLGNQGALMTLGGLMALWLIARGEWRGLKFALITAAACLIIPTLLKWGFQVPRPAFVANPPSSYSFPSGHAFSATLIWGFLYVVTGRHIYEGLKPWVLGVSLTMIIFTAVSRPFLGVHWTSDIIAGLALGLGCLGIIRWAWFRGEGLSRVKTWEPAIVIAVALTITGLIWVWPDWATALVSYSEVPLTTP